ncbi:MAG: hypothetical protein AAFU53_06525 [Cyanobacteria bacterium J06632_3]
MKSVRSATTSKTVAKEKTQEAAPALLPPEYAADYVARLSQHLAVCSSPRLIRLKLELTAALADVSSQGDISDEDYLEKQSHLLWLCNQCDYYLTDSMPVASDGTSDVTRVQKSRSLWQIKSVVATLILLKLLNYVRKLRSGSTPPVPTWQELLPDIRLWLMK